MLVLSLASSLLVVAGNCMIMIKGKDNAAAHHALDRDTGVVSDNYVCDDFQ